MAEVVVLPSTSEALARFRPPAGDTALVFDGYQYEQTREDVAERTGSAKGHPRFDKLVGTPQQKSTLGAIYG